MKLFRALFAFRSAVWYFVQWRRGKKKPQRTIVDATATVVEEGRD